MTAQAPIVIPVGDNPARMWGLTPRRRLERMAAAEGLALGGSGPGLLVDLRFVFDPAWLRWAAANPGHAVTRGGAIALAHCRDEAEAKAVERAMAEGVAAPAGMQTVAQEEFGSLHNKMLRKREQPFLEALTDGNARALERTSYYASYKGVTDLLTKYLWPEWALVLTRAAARAGIAPNAVTLVGAALCVAAGLAFYQGWYWTGLVAGLAFMVLDTVDGKLARCTITSSRIGDALDHGIDLIHPLIWYWAWGEGLHAYGRPLERELFIVAMAALVVGYVLQRITEGLFIMRFRIDMHVWAKADSRFRLVTARRNPNMVILFAALAVGYPDVGLLAVAAWTILSCAFHALRLVQAELERRRGRKVESWLQ